MYYKRVKERKNENLKKEGSSDCREIFDRNNVHMYYIREKEGKNEGKEPTIRNSYQFPNVPSHKWQNWKVDNGSSILSGLVVKLNNSK